VHKRNNFRINDSGNGWDGMVNDQMSPIGVYVYYLVIEFEDGSEELFHGSIILH